MNPADDFMVMKCLCCALSCGLAGFSTAAAFPPVRDMWREQRAVVAARFEVLAAAPLPAAEPATQWRTALQPGHGRHRRESVLARAAHHLGRPVRRASVGVALALAVAAGSQNTAHADTAPAHSAPDAHTQTTTPTGGRS